jgi:translocation and assembly module TamA
VLIAKVTPGEPVRIGGTEVILRGGARTDRDYLDLLKTRPAIGTVLNHGDYDGFKSSLTRVALRKGYFDSEFNKSQLGVSRPASGLLGYRLRQRRALPLWPVTFEGSQIRDEYLQNLVPFKQGDYYTSQDLAELNRRLAATGWFSSVVVAPSLISPAKPKCCLCRALSRRAKRTPWKPGSATQPTSGRA